MDLAAFLAGYRDDGWGRAAHDPAMMVALLVYAYAIGERSSRRIERRCDRGRRGPGDRAPTRRRITRRSRASASATSGRWASCSATCLELCAEAGLVARRGDRGRRHEGARQRVPARQPSTTSRSRARSSRRPAAIDADEDEQFGDRRGDELPPELSTAQGRRGWLRDAKRRLDERRAEEARPIPASRPARLKEAKRRLEEELWTECQANAAYEAYRARGRMKDGRRFGRPPDPYQPPDDAGGRDQPHRPGLAQRQDLARLGAGLQRPGRRQPPSRS